MFKGSVRKVFSTILILTMLFSLLGEQLVMAGMPKDLSLPAEEDIVTTVLESSFEDDDTSFENWSSGGKLERVTDSERGGQVAKITRNGKYHDFKYGDVKKGTGINLKPGATYYISYWIKCEGGSGNLDIQTYWERGGAYKFPTGEINGNYGSESYPEPLPRASLTKGEWSNLKGTVTLPTDIKWGNNAAYRPEGVNENDIVEGELEKLLFYIRDANPDTTFYVDDVCIYEIKAPVKDVTLPTGSAITRTVLESTFEADDTTKDSWSGGTAIEMVADNERGGQVAKITRSSQYHDFKYGKAHTNGFTLKQGATYYISYWIKREGEGASNIGTFWERNSVYQFPSGANNGNQSTSGSYPEPLARVTTLSQGQWVNIKGMVTLPANSVKWGNNSTYLPEGVNPGDPVNGDLEHILFYIRESNPTTTLYVDDVCIYEVVPVAPVASNVTVSGTPQAGQILSGSYKYSDDNQDAEVGSTYRWLRADTETGTYEPIENAIGSVYTLTADDVGKYIKFEVTPKSAKRMVNNSVWGEEKEKGKPVVSDPVEILSQAVPPSQSPSEEASPSPSPTASAVIKINSLLPGETVAAGVDLTAEGGSSYQWQKSADGETGWQDISGATNAVYTAPASDINSYLRVRSGSEVSSTKFVVKTPYGLLTPKMDEVGGASGWQTINEDTENISVEAAPTGGPGGTEALAFSILSNTGEKRFGAYGKQFTMKINRLYTHMAKAKLTNGADQGVSWYVNNNAGGRVSDTNNSAKIVSTWTDTFGPNFGGAAGPSLQSAWREAGNTVYKDTDPRLTAKTNFLYFANAKGNGENAGTNFSISNWYFIEHPIITAKSNGGGEVKKGTADNPIKRENENFHNSVPALADGQYWAGNTVHLIAEPADGYQFAGWYNNEMTKVSSDADFRFRADKDQSLTAVFEPTTGSSASPIPLPSPSIVPSPSPSAVPTPPSTEPEGNIMSNPNFDTMAGWVMRGDSKPSIAEGEGPNGENAAKIERTGPYGSLAQYGKYLEPGKTYHLSVMVKRDGALPCELRIHANQPGVTWNGSSYPVLAKGMIGSEWTELKGTFTVPDNANFIDAAIYPQFDANSEQEPTSAYYLANFYIWPAPTAQANDIQIDKNVAAGNPVSGSYSFFYPEGNVLDISTYNWLISDTADGEYKVAAGQNASGTVTTSGTIPAYTPMEQEVGKYIKLEITPKGAGVLDGDVGYSTPSYIKNTLENQPPVVSNVRINGKVKATATVNVLYDYMDLEQDEDASLYQWEISENETEGFKEISGQTTSEITLPIEYAGKYIRVKVMPKDNKGAEGQEVTSDAAFIEDEAVEDAILIYVDSEAGDDQTGTGSIDKPYKSIEKAQAHVRTINTSMSSDIVVYLRGGVYDLTKNAVTRQAVGNGKINYPVRSSTLTFGSEDGGTNGYKVKYKAYPGEKPVLSGGKNLSGWTMHDAANGIYKTTIPADILAAYPDFDTRQLYVNGTRAIRARSDGKPENYKWKKGVSGQTTTDLSMADWKNQSDIEFVYNCNWCNHRAAVESITSDGKKATITMQPTIYNLILGTSSSTTIRNASQLQWIENAYELLDSDGEWYLDKSGAIGGTPYTIYYKPCQGEDMSSATVTVPVIDELLTARGTSLDQPLENLEFNGISFQYSTWVRPSALGGYYTNQTNVDRETNAYLESAVTVATVRNVNFMNCEFSHMGNNALTYEKEAQDCSITGNRVYDISGNGIFMCPAAFGGGNAAVSADARALNKNNHIDNNHLYRVAYEYASSYVVGIGYLQGSTINHNEIYHTTYTAIGLGWHNGADQVVKENEIKGNRIRDIEVSGIVDGGAFYSLGPTAGTKGIDSPGYWVMDNYISNQPYYHAPFFLDNSSSGWYVENNVIDQSMTPKLNMTNPAESIKWAYLQLESLGPVTNSTLINNFYSDVAVLDDRSLHESNTLGPNIPIKGVQWPEAAQTVMESAGLEKEYQDIRVWNETATYNGGFEFVYIPEDNNVWKTRNAQLARTNSEKYEGIHSGKVTLEQAAGSIYQDIMLKKDTTYKASAWVKLDKGVNSAKNAEIRISGETLATSVTQVNSDGWTKLEGFFDSNITTENGLGLKRVELYIDGLEKDSVYYVDEFNVEQYKPSNSELIETAKTILSGITSTDGLGEYTTSARDTLDSTLAIFETLYSDPSTPADELQAAANNLLDAVNAMRSSIVHKVSLNPGENVTVPEKDASGAEFTNAEITMSDGNTITLPETSGGIILHISGIVNDQVQNMDLEIPAGTVIGGSRTINSQSVTMSGEASIKLESTLNLAAKLNAQGTTFDKPVKLTFIGQGGNVYYVNGTSLTVVESIDQNTQQAAMAAGKAAVRYQENGNTSIWTNNSLEFLMGSRLSAVTGNGEDGNNENTDNPGSNGGNSGDGVIVIPGQPSPSPEKEFEDIEGHWAKTEIEELADKGIITGVTETAFEPDRNITRAEFTTLIAKAFKLQAAGENIYQDVPEEAWYASYVKAASAAGIVTGYNGIFRPDDFVTREEMAIMMSRAYTMKQLDVPVLAGLDGFRDKDEISAWAESAVDFAVSAGMMNGMDDGRFAPKENTTRAQTAVVLKRLLDKIK